MKRLLYKEMRLSASLLTYCFLAGGLLTMVPGYPILLSAFFITLGIFYSFQSMRENNDLNYSLLLPVSKADIVKGKFAFVLLMECSGFVLMTLLTVIRMTLFNSAGVYVANALMGANLFFLGYALVIFGLFNRLFIGGFFKTAFYLGKPFIRYGIATLAVILLAESLPHFPGLAILNELNGDHLLYQLIGLLTGAAIFALLTIAGIKRAVRRFSVLDC